MRGAPAGDRLFALIGIGSGVVGIIAAHGAPNALAGVITGIGFIGGGLVFRQAVRRNHVVVGSVSGARGCPVETHRSCPAGSADRHRSGNVPDRGMRPGVLPGAGRGAVTVQHLGFAGIPGAGGAVGVQHDGPAHLVVHHLVMEGAEENAVLDAGLAAVGPATVMSDIPPSERVRDAWESWSTDRRRAGIRAVLHRVIIKPLPLEQMPTSRATARTKPSAANAKWRSCGCASNSTGAFSPARSKAADTISQERVSRFALRVHESLAASPSLCTTLNTPIMYTGFG